MRFMPLILASMAFAVVFALMAQSGVGAIYGLGDAGAEAELDRQAEAIEDEDGDIEAQLEAEEDAGLLGDVVSSVRGALTIGATVLWLGSALESIGLWSEAVPIVNWFVRIMLGLWIYQTIRGTEIL